MRFAHISSSASEVPRLAVVSGDLALFAADVLPNAPHDLQAFLEQSQDAQHEMIQRLGQAVAAMDAGRGEHPEHAIESMHFASSVLRPPAVLAVGLNYSEHASELSLEGSSGPVLFSLFPNSLTGHKQQVQLPVALSREVDYEAELAVIIGRPAKNVSPEDALDYVFGYTAVNDITARNLQFSEPQWSRCKSFDTFTPTGPVVVTADEIPDPQQTWIRTVVDGVVVQDAPASDMVRGVAQLISELSQGTTLAPGTLISTGSPGGAGRSRTPQLYLHEGTVVTVSVDAIGELTSYCVEV